MAPVAKRQRAQTGTQEVSSKHQELLPYSVQVTELLTEVAQRGGRTFFRKDLQKRFWTWSWATCLSMGTGTDNLQKFFPV